MRQQFNASKISNGMIMLHKQPILHLPLVILFHCLAVVPSVAEISQKIPTPDVPLPLLEKMLHGNVIRMVESVERVKPESDTQPPKISIVWEKVEFDDTVTPLPEMTFLMPWTFLQQNATPYFRTTDSRGQKGICFLVFINWGNYLLVPYDSQGRIRGILLSDLLQILSFRYKFMYNDENEMDCHEVKLFFRDFDEASESEIGQVKLQYENGRLMRMLSDGGGYFFGKEKKELTYDEDGFLTSEANFDGPDKHEPRYVTYYRNYEQDHHKNWIRRDVYLDEQRIRTEKREIYYAGDTLPEILHDEPDHIDEL